MDLRWCYFGGHRGEALINEYSSAFAWIWDDERGVQYRSLQSPDFDPGKPDKWTKLSEAEAARLALSRDEMKCYLETAARITDWSR
jgi:hypothetical protein